MTHIQRLNVEGSFPIFITPSNKAIEEQEGLDLLERNKAWLTELLLKRGALIFRNFPIKTADTFQKVIETLNLGSFVNYIGGDSPRNKVKEHIYTSTEAPPSLKIPLHQELSFITNAPKHIYFFCETAPINGGETIIADARRVYASLHYKVKTQFESKGLTYISHYYYQSKIMDWLNQFERSHKSWTEVFETNHKEEVEQKCLENNFTWRWLPKNWIEVKQTRPATRLHPLTKEVVWFNQAHLFDFNPRLLGWKRYVGAKLFYFKTSSRLHEIRYADGTRIRRKDLYHILDVLNQNTVKFPWMTGDVMVLDNVLAMHGRASFTGHRRILTALTA